MSFKTARDLLNGTGPRREESEERGEKRTRRGEEEEIERERERQSSKGKHLEGLPAGTCLYIARVHYILHGACMNSLTR